MLNRLRLEGLTVLIAEDDPLCNTLFIDIFEYLGAKVIAVTSVREALEILEHCVPDVLISDIRFPEEDGYFLIKQVRAYRPERGGQTPAIAVTTLADDEAKMRLLEAGFQGHIAKPFEIETLVTLVRELARK